MNIKDLDKINTGLNFKALESRKDLVLLFYLPNNEYYLFNFKDDSISNTTKVFTGIGTSGMKKIRVSIWEYKGNALYMTNLSSYIDVENIAGLTDIERKYLVDRRRDILDSAVRNKKYREILTFKAQTNE